MELGVVGSSQVGQKQGLGRDVKWETKRKIDLE